MMDDIGLGKAIAEVIYLMILAIGIIGVWFFLKRKNKTGVVFWASLMLNFFFFLYFMGSYSFYPGNFYLIVNQYWPWINIVLFVLLIINFVKDKNEKAKGNNNID